VQDITKEAKVAKGSFYTYFKRKEDVLYELGWQPFIELANEIEAMPDKNIVERLKYYCYEFMRGVEVFGVNICRGWIRDVINPNNVTYNSDCTKWEFDIKIVTDILNKAIQNGELKENTPVEALARLIISQLYGMTTGWCMSDCEFEPLDWIDRFCEIQLKQVLQPYII
jgi:AcrR family transcriptional regulator